MNTKTVARSAARATLAQVTEGQTLVDLGQIAEALGTRLDALERVADLAYPLSPGDHAVQCLLRDLSRTLSANAKRIGLNSALAELAGAASNPRPECLQEILARP